MPWTAFGWEDDPSTDTPLNSAKLEEFGEHIHDAAVASAAVGAATDAELAAAVAAEAATRAASDTALDQRIDGLPTDADVAAEAAARAAADSALDLRVDALEAGGGGGGGGGGFIRTDADDATIAAGTYPDGIQIWQYADLSLAPDGLLAIWGEES